MSWLIITILFYLMLAVAFLVDKYLLAGPVPNAKALSFYIGILGILALLLAPFVGFYIPEIKQIVLAISAGASFIYALYWFFRALRLFEISRVVPAIGGISPFFILGLIYIFSGGKESLKLWEFLSFLLMVLGSVFITYEKEKKISLESLKISIIAAFFFALSFVLTKYVYLQNSFWTGFIWTKIGGVLMALFFLLSREMREELFKARINFSKKTAIIFLSGQAVGFGSNVLQNLAFAIAPLIYLSVISALQGIQYVFLLAFTVFLSFKFPQILKEEVSKKILLQKILAILLIGGGLVALAFK